MRRRDATTENPMSRQDTTEKTTAAAHDEPNPAPAEGTPAGNRPLRVFRARGVSVAVFENHTTIEGRPVRFLKAELRRVYKDGDQFRTTHALSANDVPVARLLLEQAFACMLEAGAESAAAGG